MPPALRWMGRPWPPLLEKLDALGPGDILVLAGSVPAAVPADIYPRILARLPRGVRAVVDAEKALLAGALAYRPFLVKPNHLELGEMFGRRLQSEAEICDCAARLQAGGAQNAGVYGGRRGPASGRARGLHRAHAPCGTVRNSVGAGDAMVAGFLAGWLQTGSYAHALKWGVAAGSATAFSDGLATKGQICALLDAP